MYSGTGIIGTPQPFLTYFSCRHLDIIFCFIKSTWISSKHHDQLLWSQTSASVSLPLSFLIHFIKGLYLPSSYTTLVVLCKTHTGDSYMEFMMLERCIQLSHSYLNLVLSRFKLLLERWKVINHQTFNKVLQH